MRVCCSASVCVCLYECVYAYVRVCVSFHCPSYNHNVFLSRNTYSHYNYIGATCVITETVAIIITTLDDLQCQIAYTVHKHKISAFNLEPFATQI